MGILDKIFKSEREITKQEIVEVPWHELSKIEQLDTIEEESRSKPVVILKHSTRCGISRMVLRQFESSYDLKKDADIKLYFLDLLSHRDISNEIADRFGVQHESPQLIVVRDEKVVHHASHQSIDAADLGQFVQN